MPRARRAERCTRNIQDVFNEHGVQIMSPHYLGDPAAAKVVPKAALVRAAGEAAGLKPDGALSALDTGGC